MPERIQRKRTKGWRMPERSVYVGRPTIYGSPFLVSDYFSPDEAVGKFAWWLREHQVGQRIADSARVDLVGRDLACWCPLDQPCHADVLLEIANGRETARAGG